MKFWAKHIFLFSFRLTICISNQAQNTSFATPQFSGNALQITESEISATISCVIADVSIRQKFIVTNDIQRDAVYLFSTSGSKTIRSLEASINRKTTDIVYKTDTLGIVSFQLANLIADDTVEIYLNYSELVELTNSNYEFCYPNNYLEKKKGYTFRFTAAI